MCMLQSLWMEAHCSKTFVCGTSESKSSEASDALHERRRGGRLERTFVVHDLQRPIL